MSSSFMNPDVLSEFDKAFDETSQGMAEMRPDYVSPIEDKRNYRDATDLAMRLAQTGATVEQQEEFVKDPRHAWKLKQYEEDVQKYNEKERLDQFAVDPAEIARLEAEGHDPREIERLRTKEQAPESVLAQAQMQQDPDSYLRERGFRGAAPTAPEEMVSKRKLREELGIPTIGSDASMTDVEFMSAQNRMIDAAVRGGKPTGIMANNEFRKKLGLEEYKYAETVDRGIIEKSWDSLSRGAYTVVGAPALASRGLVAYGAELVAGKNSFSDAMWQEAMYVNAMLQGAKSGQNIDPITGANHGEIPHNFFYAGLESAPQFAIDIAMAMGSGGGSLAFKGAQKAATKRMKRQVERQLAVGALTKEEAAFLVKQAGEKAVEYARKRPGAEAALRKAIAKRQRRVFTAYGGAQSFANQMSQSMDYYLTQKNMDPSVIGGLVIGEAVSAGLATAITMRISSEFMFTNTPTQYLARTFAKQGIRNYMIGALSEGMQESADQFLTDAALASIAHIRDDEEKLAQVGFLREGYLYKLATAAAAGGMLGGPAGVATRAGRGAIQGETETDGGLSVQEVDSFLQSASIAQQRNQEYVVARQKAIAESTSGIIALGAIGDADLNYALFNGLNVEGATIIYAGKGENRFRVTPLIAQMELQRRGVIAGTVDEAFISDVLQGPRAIQEVSRADLRAAADETSQIYYEARDGRRTLLPASYARKEIERRKRAGEPEDGRPRLWSRDQGAEFEREIMSGTPTADTVTAVIVSAPDIALQAIDNGSLSRKQFNQIMGALTGDPRDRGSSTDLRAMLFAELAARRSDISQESEARQNVHNEWMQAGFRQGEVDGAPQEFRESTQRETDFRSTLEEREALTDEPVALTSQERNLIDSAIDAVSEENILQDTSKSNREVARMLPRYIPFAKRLARVRELRSRSGIQNAITNSRASETVSELDAAQAQSDLRGAASVGVVDAETGIETAPEETANLQQKIATAREEESLGRELEERQEDKQVVEDFETREGLAEAEETPVLQKLLPVSGVAPTQTKAGEQKETEPEVQPQVEPETEPETEPEVEPEVETEPEVEPEADPKKQKFIDAVDELATAEFDNPKRLKAWADKALKNGYITKEDHAEVMRVRKEFMDEAKREREPGEDLEYDMTDAWGELQFSLARAETPVEVEAEPEAKTEAEPEAETDPEITEEHPVRNKYRYAGLSDTRMKLSSGGRNVRVDRGFDDKMSVSDFERLRSQGLDPKNVKDALLYVAATTPAARKLAYHLLQSLPQYTLNQRVSFFPSKTPGALGLVSYNYVGFFEKQGAPHKKYLQQAHGPKGNKKAGTHASDTLMHVPAGKASASTVLHEIVHSGTAKKIHLELKKAGGVLTKADRRKKGKPHLDVLKKYLALPEAEQDADVAAIVDLFIQVVEDPAFAKYNTLGSSSLLKREGPYALENIDEFLAEALTFSGHWGKGTNKVRKFLANTKYKGTQQSLLSKLIDLVKSIAKIDPNTNEASMLDALLYHQDRLMSAPYDIGARSITDVTLSDVDFLNKDVDRSQAVAQNPYVLENFDAQVDEDTDAADSSSFTDPDRANMGELEQLVEQVAPELSEDTDVEIDVEKAKVKLGVLSKVMVPLFYASVKAGKDSAVYKAIVKILHTESKWMITSQQEKAADAEKLSKMPSEWKGKNNHRLAQIMDTYVPMVEDSEGNLVIEGETKIEYLPRESDTVPIKQRFDELPTSVQDAIIHFKKRAEEMRLESIEIKRASLSELFGGMGLPRLRQQARDKVEKGDGLGIRPNLRVTKLGGDELMFFDPDTNDFIEKADLVEELVLESVPDDWGRQFSHYHHHWFGAYKLTARLSDGTSHVIGDANSEQEAYFKLQAFKESTDLDVVKLEANIEYENTNEFLKISGPERQRLVRSLQKQSQMTNDQINKALIQGKVSVNGNTSPFFGAHLERKSDAQGYSMNFGKVWEHYTDRHNRWKFGGMMNRDMQPVIDRMKKSGSPWGNYLEETLTRALFIQPTKSEVISDTFLQNLPHIGKRLGPMPTRRTLSAVRSFTYLRMLKTPKQWAVNSIQPLQTVYPMVGERLFIRAVKEYNGAEGKAFMRKYGAMDTTAGQYIDGTAGSTSQRMIDLVTKAQKLADKHVTRGKISTQSEQRNMNFAAYAFYIHGIDQGMSEADAVEYGRTQGYYGSQFIFSRANMPPILNGPIASTLFQFRRFQLNMIGHVSELIATKNLVGTGRWLAVNALAGGVKGVLMTALPAYWLIMEGCEKLGLCDEYQSQKADMLKMRNELVSVVGEEHANAITFGLPAYLGGTISSSLGLFHPLHGETLPEQIASQLEGPSLGNIRKFITDLQKEEVTDVSIATKAYRSFRDTSPAFKWIARNVEVLSGVKDEYDVQGRLRYRNEDMWRNSFLELGGAFRTVDKEIMSLEFDLMMEMQSVVDKAADRAATLFGDKDYVGAMDVLAKHNAAHPDMSLNIKELKRRIGNKEEAKNLETNTRNAMQRSKKVQDAYRKKLADWGISQ